MKDSISRIKKQPTEIAVVKLADRLFNLHIKVPTWSPEKQESYKKEAQLICDELGYASETLRSQLQKAIDEYLYAECENISSTSLFFFSKTLILYHISLSKIKRPKQ